MAELGDLAIEWHHIGRIQNNKTRVIAERFQWAHGVTDEHQARRLSQQRPPACPRSTSASRSMSATRPRRPVLRCHARALAQAVAALPNLRLRGLMAIPEPAADVAAQRRPFRALRELSDRLRAGGLELDTLSMACRTTSRRPSSRRHHRARRHGLFGPRPAKRPAEGSGPAGQLR